MDDLYDEFGNFIGEAASDEEGSQDGVAGQHYVYDEESDAEEQPAADGLMEVDDEGPSNAVILHEDKQYYPTAQQVYGEDVETMVQEEDAQPLTQPIIAPVTQKKFQVQEADLPPVHYSREFMSDLLSFPEGIRNIAVAGHLHHGKTAFVDMLVMQTHDLQERLDKRIGRRRDEQLRYTDTHFLERERGLSIKAAPISMVMQGTRGKSHILNIIDTPGHVNFVDEVASSMRLVDGVVLVVDVVEGVQINTEQAIKHAVLEDLPMVLVVNKMDRLILELKIPPTDAYFKLKHVVEEVNTVIENTIPGRGEKRRLSPEKGNVAFACTSMDWVFTLPSFAKMYAETYPKVEANEFSRRLWGDIFFNPRSRKFTRKGVEEGSKRAFVNFVLEPIYKLYAHSISESPEDLAPTLKTLGITLKPSQLKSDARDLLKLVCAQFFGPASGFVDMVVQHLPSPVDGAKRMLDNYYTGPLDSKVGEAMTKCDSDGPLVVEVTKLFSSVDAKTFHAFGRILSGTASSDQVVRVLGESYSVEDEEDSTMSTITATHLACSRYNIPVSGVPAGNLVLLSGIDNSMVKTATVVAEKFPDNEDAYIFKPIRHFTESVFKVAVEPVNPSELPKMLEGLRKINKSYPLITTKVEESGEHVVLGTGELYMDCVLHDLRTLFAEMDIKVSDPVTRFCETVTETSAIMCYALTPNKKNKLTMIAEPLDDGVAEDIEAGVVKIRDPIRKVAKFFEEKYEWDKLAARSIWAFGPEEMGPNILCDDTLPSTTDKKLLKSVQESIKQGFSWGTREGPLCEEPIRNTKFRVTGAELAPEPIFRGGGQIIPTARRAVYSSFLMAGPRLMEPVYSVHMTGPADAVSGLYTVLMKRRGHVVSDGPVAGTPLYAAKALIPVIDSFGFETDLRIHSQGAASVSLVFDRWDVVPGDPLDKSIKIRPLEMAGPQQAARDFVLKTRRRKGLSEDVDVKRFLEPELLAGLRESGVLD
ncbi:elongation factor 2 [Cladophialophora yegresii CBS 114405]|uniref:Elongation factor 2 n=1 Tax=Cladophialophora yegresii CBS 114405 TaxID=1182544 RepID=W9WEQ4_9EURO|nr:elongation factor 2 [Cladophialophora yegresii CBS 114405]EXJ57009.1 elongation factor 2 [Cladophialophora yegresii CBS 114405]